MKLAYITNVKITSSDAQSIQVDAMCQSFSAKLKDDFLLVSPKVKNNLDSKYKWKRVFIFQRLPRFVRYGMFIKLTWFTVFKFKPDVIYSRDIGVVWFYNLFGYKTVYEIHKPFETRVGECLFERLLKKIRVVVISKALKDFIIDKYYLDEKNILVAHDSVDLGKFIIEKTKQECRQEFLHVEDDKKVIMYTGSFQPGKGIEVIMALAQKLQGYLFFVIGDKTDENDLVNLKFINRQENEKIPYFLKAADLLLLPNTRDLKYYKYTSPLKLFEYMASGTPIISSKIGSIIEILNDNNAFLFDPENIDEGVKTVENIFNNYYDAIEKSNQALLDVKENTWEKRAEKILDFIK